MRNAVAIACFVLSGAAGLIYEICWIRQASLTFGSTTLAVSTVLAVFFLGLAVGSLLFGRIATRLVRPLRLFALMEIGIGALALVSLPLFGMADALYDGIYRSLLSRPALLALVRVLLVAVILLPPTFLMGGTLPLFCRQFVVRKAKIANSVGFLYGVNTLGAAAGCAAAGFYLLPALGLRGTLLAGALLSLAAGVSLLLLRLEAKPPREAAARDPGEAAPPVQRTVGAIFFFSGLVAIGGEVLWSRYLALLIRNTVYTYTITLTVVLVGIVLGSLLAGARFDRVRSRAFSFGLLQALTGLSVVTVMMLPPAVWDRLGESVWVYIVCLLPPAVLSGASFPLAVRMVVETPALASLGVGRLTALNTLGGIVGSLAVGFYALPDLGLQPTLFALTALSLALGFTAWIRLDAVVPRPVRWGFIAVFFAGWVFIPRALGTSVPADFLAGDARLLDYREGMTSNLAVVVKRDVKRLEIDRMWQGEDRKNHQALAAHIPMLLHPSPRRVLVVGAGTGQTPSRFLMYDIDHLSCVDIEPAVFDVIRDHFSSDWMDDDRVRIIEDDGRNFLSHTSETYDVISLEVGQIYRPGIAFFYTKDFYEEARRRLADGGYLSQFVPMPFFTVEQFRGVLRTFLDVFPNATLWYNTSELLLIGTKGERISYDGERLAGLLGDGAIGADLAYSHWGGADAQLRDPDVFLGSFLSGPGALDALSSGGPVYTDDRPVLDHATQGVQEYEILEVPLLDLVRTHLEPAERYFHPAVPGTDTDAVGRVREANLGDIAASAYIRQASWLIPTEDYAQIERLLRLSLEWNAESFVGHRMLGEATAMQGRFGEALDHYGKAVGLRPGDLRARRGLGTTLVQVGRYQEGIDELRQAIRLKPDDPECHNNLGVALASTGKVEEGLMHFQEALRLRPDYADAERNIERLRQSVR